MQLSRFQKMGVRLLGLEKKLGNAVALVDQVSAGQKVLDTWDVLRAIDRDLKQNPFLASATKKRAEANASVPFFVEAFRRGEWVREENHEAAHLIEGANPHMSGSELKLFWAYHKELAGQLFSQIVMARDRPVYLQPLFPQYMEVIPGSRRLIERFDYTINPGKPKPFKPEEVFWSKYVDPENPFVGLSPLRAIAGELQTDAEAILWNSTSLSHRGATDAAFVFKDVTTPDQWNEARKMVEDRYTGGMNGRRPWILGGNTEVKPLSYTPVEMDYLNTRVFNRQVIAAAIGVPAPLIGDADNSTYNNLDTLKRVFWEDSVIPFLESLRQDLTRQVLLPYFSNQRTTTSRPKLRYMYDVSNVEALAKNMEERATIAKLFRQAGFSTRQINERLNLGFDDELADPTPAPIPSDEGGSELGSAGIRTEGMPPELKAAVLHWSRELSMVIAGFFNKKFPPEQVASMLSVIHGKLCKEFGTWPDIESANRRGGMVKDAMEVVLSEVGRDGAYAMLSERLAPKLAAIEVREALNP